MSSDLHRHEDHKRDSAAADDDASDSDEGINGGLTANSVLDGASDVASTRLNTDGQSVHHQHLAKQIGTGRAQTHRRKGDGEQPKRETKCCKCCQIEMQSVEFKDKSAVCIECDLAAESYQRKLRREWGKQYKSNYKKLKSEEKGEKSRLLILDHRHNGRKGGRVRTLARDEEGLKKVDKKTKARRRRAIYSKLTFDGDSVHFEKPENGGYTKQDVQRHWEK